MPLRACIEARRFSIVGAKITVEKKKEIAVISPLGVGFESHPTRHKFSRKGEKQKNILSLRLRLSALLL